MPRRNSRFLAIYCLWLAVSTLRADTPQTVQFERDIAPLLEARCLECHNDNLAKGKMSLTTADRLLEAKWIHPGQSDESPLIGIISHGPGEEPPEMPQKGDPLTPDEIALIRQWIDAGADWPSNLRLKEPSKAGKDWWAFQPLKKTAPPMNADGPEDWRQNPIDAFVFQKLRENELAPSPPASRRSLIRRLSYDLTGLPPTPQEAEAFIQDESPRAYERLVDRLLASPRYGERWGRHWLDVIRFGESRGFERNEIIRNLWPFRDYIIRSFNEDKPFDRLILEHLAGDVIGSNQPEVEIGTAFLACGPYDDVGNQDPKQAAQIRANAVDEIIRATGEAFLGLTVGCARCHDHKFDPISQSDYYGWHATFAGVYHGERIVARQEERMRYESKAAPIRKAIADLEKERNDLIGAVLARANQSRDEILARYTRPAIDRTLTEESFEPVNAKYIRLVVEGTESDPRGRSNYHIDEFEVWTAGPESRNAALASEGGRAEGSSRTAEDFADAYSPSLTIDGRYGARWIAQGPVLTIILARPEQIDRVRFSSDRTGNAAGHSVASFVSEYRIETSLDGEDWRLAATSYQRKPVNDRHRDRRLIDETITAAEQERWNRLNAEFAENNRSLRSIPPLNRWWAGQFRPANHDFHIFLGGDPQREGPPVRPASLSALNETANAYELKPDVPEDRRRLELAEWIIDPSNPLTPRVLANRVWHYHFGTGLVDTPSDFGYMGGRPTHPELLDWLASKLVESDWRLKPLHRLIVTSQAYRQSASHRKDAAQKDSESRLLWRFPPRRLSAEEIRDTMLAVSGKLKLGMGGPGFQLYRYLQDNVATYVPLDQHGPETYRRSVYHHFARATFVDLFTEFDCPDNAFPSPRRAITTTPLQALTLMNHSFTLDMAGHLSRRLEAEAGVDNRPGQIRLAFQLAYSRPPATEEMDVSLELAGAHGLRAFCRALLNSNELIYLN